MKLWLDDVRQMPEGYNLWAKSVPEAIKMISENEITFVSFDHDLGDDEVGTGYDLAVWIEERAYMNSLPRMGWRVHSANPVGVKRIVMAMNSATTYWNKNNS